MAVATIYTGALEQAGNGVQTVFTFAIKILAATDLVVRKKAADGSYSAPLAGGGVDYTLAFDSTAETATVTFTVAPVNLGAANVTRASDKTQGTVYPREGVLPAKTTETAVDKLTMLVQEALTWLTKRVPSYAAWVVNPPALTISPVPADRRALVYSANGDGTFTIIPSTNDPDLQATQAAASATAAAASQGAAAASAAAALASQNAAAVSAASASTIASALQLNGLYAAKPAAPTVTTIYYSTDRDSAELWLPAAGRWFLLG